MHEALLERWPRLADWLEEDAQGRRLHRHLTRAAAEWEASGRERASSTAAPASPRRSSGPTPPATAPASTACEREFLAESRTAFARANRRLRGAPRRGAPAARRWRSSRAPSRWRRAGLRAARRPRRSPSGSAPQALVDPDLDRSLLLAREGVNLDDSATTRSNLLAELLRSPAAIRHRPRREATGCSTTRSARTGGSSRSAETTAPS